MPKRTPLVSASGITALAAAASILLSGGHSPFEPRPAAGADGAIEAPAAAAGAGEALVAAATGSPIETPAATPAPTAVAVPAAPAPTRRPANGSTRVAAPAPARTSLPTADPTAPATPEPVAAPTSEPTDRPSPDQAPRQTSAPARERASLSVALADGHPVLSWSTCTSDSFAAYAVVRSLDSEIHFPAEDNDTLVAMITSRDATQLTDTGAPSRKVYYRVWCLAGGGGDSSTISTTPTVSVTVP